MTKVDPLSAVTAERWYPAGPDVVFRALTEPALLERWFCPAPDVALRVEHLDLRVGGRYRFVFDFPEGSKPVIGEYRAIDRPRRLDFTWTWEPPDPHAGLETLVTMVLTERDGGTDLSVVHERLPDVPTRHRHESGWNATLARLEQSVIHESGGSHGRHPDGAQGQQGGGRPADRRG